MDRVIEGTWEEIASHASEFRGRRLRIQVLPQESQKSTDVRLDALKAWLDLPRPDITHVIDDSRAAIYSKDEDRG